MAYEKRFFVLCPSFHGATLLAKLLNAHPDISALGDTYPSNAFDQTCGCGAKVSACQFWQETRRRLPDHYSPDSPAWLPFWPGQSKNIAQRLRFSDYLFRRRLNPNNADKYFSTLQLEHLRAGHEAFLEAVFEQMPARIYVDGVKSIARLSCLVASGTQIDGIIHIIRNPNDFLASAMRNTGRKGALGAIEHALRWRNYHSKVGDISQHIPRHSMHYETLAKDTDTTLHDLFRFLGCPTHTVQSLQSGLQQEWHFMGNFSVTKFDGAISPSTHRLPAIQKSIVNCFAGSRS